MMKQIITILILMTVLSCSSTLEMNKIYTEKNGSQSYIFYDSNICKVIYHQGLIRGEAWGNYHQERNSVRVSFLQKNRYHKTKVEFVSNKDSNTKIFIRDKLSNVIDVYVYAFYNNTSKILFPDKNNCYILKQKYDSILFTNCGIGFTDYKLIITDSLSNKDVYLYLGYINSEWATDSINIKKSNLRLALSPSHKRKPNLPTQKKLR